MPTHKLEIIELFKKDPSKTYTTSQIVEIIHKDKLEKYSKPFFLDYFDESYKKYKREKLKLHRHVLYHLNQLVEKGLLKVVGTEYNGEKIFAVPEDLRYVFTTLPANKIIHLDLIALDVPKFVFSTPADKYFSEKVVLRAFEFTWTRKLNSFVIDASKFKNLTELDKFLDKVLFLINDSVAIVKIEQLFEKDFEHIQIFLTELFNNARTYNKTINFIIDLNKFEDLSKMMEILNKYVEKKDDSLIKFIFILNLQDMHMFKDTVKQIIDKYMEAKFRFNVINKTIFKGLIFEGLLGTYSMTEKELDEITYSQIKSPLIVINNVSLTIDFNKFIKTYGTEAELYKLMRACVKTLFIARRYQRSTKNELLYELFTLTKTPHHEIFRFGKEYIRIWNYKWNKLEEGSWIKIFNDLKGLLTELGAMQEAIYKSAGLPLSFKVELANAFNKLFKKEGVERSYEKYTIYSTNDLKSKELKQYLRIREALIKIFDNNDRVRFFRDGRFNVDDVFEEILYIMHFFSVPYFSYDFEKQKGNIMKLTDFFERAKRGK